MRRTTGALRLSASCTRSRAKPRGPCAPSSRRAPASQGQNLQRSGVGWHEATPARLPQKPSERSKNAAETAGQTERWLCSRGSKTLAGAIAPLNTSRRSRRVTRRAYRSRLRRTWGPPERAHTNERHGVERQRPMGCHGEKRQSAVQVYISPRQKPVQTPKPQKTAGCNNVVLSEPRCKTPSRGCAKVGRSLRCVPGGASTLPGVRCGGKPATPAAGAAPPKFSGISEKTDARRWQRWGHQSGWHPGQIRHGTRRSGEPPASS